MLPEITVVSCGSLFLELNVFCKTVFRRKGDAVHALQRVVSGLAEPVRGRVLGEFDCLDCAGGAEMGPHAQVHQVAAAIGAGHRSIGHLVLDQMHLERVVLRIRPHLP